MLKLGGQIEEARHFAPDAGRLLMRLSDHPERPKALRSQEAFLVRTKNAPPPGFQAYLAFDVEALRELPSDAPCALLPHDFDYLGRGDIVRLEPGRREIRVLFRHGSRHNSFLTTEQCNHYCLMCSQPPKRVDDAWLATPAPPDSTPAPAPPPPLARPAPAQQIAAADTAPALSPGHNAAAPPP